MAGDYPQVSSEDAHFGKPETFNSLAQKVINETKKGWK